MENFLMIERIMLEQARMEDFAYDQGRNYERHPGLS